MGEAFGEVVGGFDRAQSVPVPPPAWPGERKAAKATPVIDQAAPSPVQPVFRFAPSPTGYLHLGHALSALIDHDLCRAAGGRFLLRIEDIDRTRCRGEFETAIYEDLAWLGLTWEEPVRRQSEHMADYAAALEQLRAMDLIYPAFMSRAEIAAATADPAWPRDPDGAPLYPAHDRDLPAAEAERRVAAGEPYALRLRMDRAVARAGQLSWTEEDEGTVTADPAAWGDVIVARKETPTSYHLSVVVDDAVQGVTHVVRGRDLYQATAIHLLLQKLLALPSPVYRHHRLILGADGRKLSKSDRATSLRSLRGAGTTPEDIRRMVGL
jgi:glutamyl-Q tRNA(Asp) synthetase